MVLVSSFVFSIPTYAQTGMMGGQQGQMGHGMMMQDMMQMMMDKMKKMMSMCMAMMAAGDSQNRLKCAEGWLKKAINLDEVHIKAPKTATEASQIKMMEQMKKAYECIIALNK